ncbi:hypothetical protein ACJX0J_015948 [Zea mays]
MFVTAFAWNFLYQQDLQHIRHFKKNLILNEVLHKGKYARQAFKQRKALVENQTGREIKKLRTDNEFDNGLEFCNSEKITGHPLGVRQYRNYGKPSLSCLFSLNNCQTVMPYMNAQFVYALWQPINHGLLLPTQVAVNIPNKKHSLHDC